MGGEADYASSQEVISVLKTKTHSQNVDSIATILVIANSHFLLQSRDGSGRPGSERVDGGADLCSQ